MELQLSLSQGCVARKRVEQETLECTRSLVGSLRRQEYRRRDTSRQGSQALRAWCLLLVLPEIFIFDMFFGVFDQKILVLENYL